MGHGFLRFIHVTSERIGGCENAVGSRIVRLLAQCLIRPYGRFVVTIREKMRKCSSNMHIVEDGVEWAEAHCSCMMLDRQVQLASISPYPTAEIPGCRQVRIQCKGPVNESCAVIKVTDKPSEGVPAPGQCNGVILAKLHGSP